MMTLVQFYLTKIAEEASEVAKIALKAQQFGLSEVQPGRDQSNAQRMYGELNDLLAMVHRLGEVSNGEFFFDIGAPDHVAVATKLGKVEKYLDYSRSLHLVEGGEPIVRWAVPRNWKPVPEVVTREMREAGLKACAYPFSLHALRNPEIIYHAMIKASPTPPCEEQVK